jgi:hypothetical protein
VIDVGRLLFAVCMVVFGIQHFMYALFIASLIPSWIPGHLFWVYFTGSGFLVAALTIAIKKSGRLGAAALGTMFLLWVIVLHTPRAVASGRNPDEWGSAFMALAMSGASFRQRRPHAVDECVCDHAHPQIAPPEIQQGAVAS